MKVPLKAYFRFFSVILLFLGNCEFAHSQAKDSVKIGFLPALGYSSDMGIIGGGILSRYHYQDGIQPFKNLLQASGIATTKGLFSFSAQFELLETYHTDIRSRYILNFGRVKESTFFGFGNNTSFDEKLWENGYYYYETYFGLTEIYGRKKIWTPGYGTAHLDIVALTNLSMESPQLNADSNMLTATMPEFVDGLWVWETGTGLVWENRDSEFSATRGNAARFELRVAPGLIMDNSSWQIQFEASQYFTEQILIFPVTAAFKLGYHQAGGSTPFWRLPKVGGEYSIRGYPEGRFIGDIALYYTAELRTWLIQYPEYNFRLGGQLFTDAGRVYDAGKLTSGLFDDHKRTFGLGAAMSLFTYDFIIRADLGFSEDMSRFYLGIGYTF
jgi:outer membrane protein assembly factor BamA